MGTVFRKQVTRLMPAGAEIFLRKGEQFARWRDKRGRNRSARVTVGTNGSSRIIVESPYYVAKYRDGNNDLQVITTGCRDETAARQVLAKLERKAELIRSG